MQSPVPIVVYNVPGRTGSNLLADTTLALAEHGNICAVKEASGNPAQISEIIRRRPAGFAVLSGDDGLTLDVMASGGDGVISVISNVVPRACAELVHAMERGDLVAARAVAPSPRPAGRCRVHRVESDAHQGRGGAHGSRRNVLRLPLVPMDPNHEPALRAALATAGVSL
jgi:4-hydroxy-tetrahydrodipicolinate synthase